MGNMQQQDIPGVSQLSPSGTQATSASKRKRQLPLSLTQAAAVTVTAIEAAQASPVKSPADPNSDAAAATAAANGDLATAADCIIAPPSKRRRRPKVQPPPAGTTGTVIVSQAADGRPSIAAAHHQHLLVEQHQLLQGPPATANQHMQHATRSGRIVTHPNCASKDDDVEVADADDSTWEWMLTAEQMLAVSDEQLLQQCRSCVAAAADGLQQVQAADADRPKQRQSVLFGQPQQQMSDRAGKAVATAVSTAGANVKLVGAQGRQEPHLQQQQQLSMLPAQQQVESKYKQQQPLVAICFQDAAVPTGPTQVATSAAAAAATAPVTSPQQQHSVQTTVHSLPLGAAGAAAAAGAGAGAAATGRAGDALAPASHAAAPRRGLANIRSRLFDED